MYIKIGPYRNYFGVYQLADLLKKIGISEERCDAIGDWLSNTWLNSFLSWIHSHQKRYVKIRIDSYDTWNMDDTLALIIVPMLQQLKTRGHGSPFVDDVDVPAHLHSTVEPAAESEHGIDGKHHERWAWVLDELIWTFTQLQGDCDWEAQYHSGKIDFVFQDSEHTYTDSKTGKILHYREMVRGPNHTHTVDEAGVAAHQARIHNGLRLFAKYYQGMWD